ncbi:helix-turn-helix transcriptional regulator [Agromyces sp. NPDC055661]|jgi:DNA-binding CsgD family transcriptional regulator
MDATTFRVRFVADTVAEAIEELEHARSPAVTIANRLLGAVHADSSSYGHIDTRSGARALETWPDVMDIELMLTASVTVPRSHPVMGHWLAGHTDVAVVSALVTDRTAWRNSEAYSLLKRGLGCTETGGIRLDTGPHTLRMIGVARQRDFTRDEIQLLEDLRRPAIVLTAHADWLADVAPGADETDSPLQRATDAGLTTREFEVLQLLSTGLLASTIAARLSISPRTVHRHLDHIYRKLDTHDRLTAVVQAQAAGMLLTAAQNSSRC